MITLNRKQDCCGCTACASICPKQCISMQEDNEGFLYPVTDTSLCVDCNACNKVCPIINQQEDRTPLQCYAAKNKDAEILLKSSSGGVFSVLAEYVISKGGVVFGARWEGDKVIHDYVESSAHLELTNRQDYQNLIAPFRGSKYVQSDLRDTFKQARQFLCDGRMVLFTGTPCEIGGLKSFLKKEYENLIAVDVACHGAPSPKVLGIYLQELKMRYMVDTIDVDFRSKITGWKHYSFVASKNGSVLLSELGRQENIFMRGFLCELYSRPSCHACSFKSFRSRSDLTLADFWGIEKVLPDIDNRGGISLLTVNSRIGAKIIDNIGIQLYPVEYQKAVAHNGSLLHSVEPHPKRDVFFQKMESGNKLSKIIQRTIEPQGLELAQLYFFAAKNKIVNIIKKQNFIKNGIISIT